MKYIRLHQAAKDISGLRYGRLVALGPVDVIKYPSGANHVQWLCRCDCGNEKIISIAKLTPNNTRSCGCLQKECYGRNKGGLKHGMHKTPEYNAWRSMLKRCNLETTPHFYLYGGRGITVCERWLKFENFLADMGLRPSQKHSLDRFPNNTDGNYEPDNCRWATASEQQRNRRNNLIVTALGRTGPLVSFFEEFGPNSRQYEKARMMIKSGKSHEESIIAGLR